MLGLENELSHEQKILEEINRQRLELLTQEQQPQWAASDPNQKARTHMMLSLLAKKSTESIHRLEKIRRSSVERLSVRSEPATHFRRLCRRSAANRLV